MDREAVLNRIRELCLALPETSERLSHGHPTFFVREKRSFLMVLTDHHGDGRFAIWCAAEEGVQEMLVEPIPTLLPAALRRAPRLARRSARPWAPLGGAGRDRRGRLRGGGAAEARRGRVRHARGVSSKPSPFAGANGAWKELRCNESESSGHGR